MLDCRFWKVSLIQRQKGVGFSEAIRPSDKAVLMEDTKAYWPLSRISPARQASWLIKLISAGVKV